MSFEEPEDVPAPSVVAVCFCHHVRRAGRAITKAFDEAFAPLGITANQFNMLAIIAAHEPVTMATLAAELATDRTTLSRNLRPLRDAGLLEGPAGPGRRAGVILLTQPGHRIFARATHSWRGVQQNLAKRLGTAQTELLLRALSVAAL